MPRQALILDIYQDEIALLIGSVPGPLAAMSLLEALLQWPTELVDAMRKKHASGVALSPAASNATIDPPGAEGTSLGRTPGKTTALTAARVGTPVRICSYFLTTGHVRLWVTGCRRIDP